MRTLIVDDDEGYREMLKIALCDYGTCEIAENGTEAFKLFCSALKDEDPFDLICLDLMMPKRDGFEAISAIRLIEKKLGLHGASGVKIVFLTGMENESMAEKALQLGAEGYVFKSKGVTHLFKTILALGLIDALPSHRGQAASSQAAAGH